VDSHPVGERKTYLNTLEKASVGQDIVPFADFLAGLVRKRWLASRCHWFRSLPHEVFLIGSAGSGRQEEADINVLAEISVGLRLHLQGNGQISDCSLF